MSFIKNIGNIFFLTASLLMCYSAEFPPTENGKGVVVIANYKWIAKFGKLTVSEGPAKPVLKNIETGEIFTTKYFDKSYAYFYNLKFGDYILEDIILDAGNENFMLRQLIRLKYLVLKNQVFFS